VEITAERTVGVWQRMSTACPQIKLWNNCGDNKLVTVE